MLRFDHLVHAVHGTPEEAAKQMQELGFHTVLGGEHTNWGTWNSLSYFDLSYIEFLAVQYEEKRKKRKSISTRNSGETTKWRRNATNRDPNRCN